MKQMAWVHVVTRFTRPGDEQSLLASADLGVPAQGRGDSITGHPGLNSRPIKDPCEMN